jgi:hypothetical protein
LENKPTKRCLALSYVYLVHITIEPVNAGHPPLYKEMSVTKQWRPPRRAATDINWKSHGAGRFKGNSSWAGPLYSTNCLLRFHQRITLMPYVFRTLNLVLAAMHNIYAFFRSPYNPYTDKNRQCCCADLTVQFLVYVKSEENVESRRFIFAAIAGPIKRQLVG